MFREFYGEFYRILDACADSAYQALFSVYEKEPGVETTTGLTRIVHMPKKFNSAVTDCYIEPLTKNESLVSLW